MNPPPPVPARVPIPGPPPVPPPPAADESGGWLGPTLIDPHGFAGFDPLGWVTRALGLTDSAPAADPAASAVAASSSPLWGWLACAGLIGIAAAAGVWAMRHWSARIAQRRDRWASGARFVEILSPPVVDARAAEAFWSQLAGLARAPWPRLRHGQPHVSFEIHAEPARLRIGLWVPSVISPRRIERTIRAAWPGALTRTHRLDIPHPLGQATTNTIPSAEQDGSETRTDDRGGLTPGVAGVVCAGWLPLGRHPVWPLRTEHDNDPLRAVLGALAGLRPGQTACIQVCARPASGAAAARFRRGSPGAGGGLLTSLSTWLPSTWSHTLASPVSLMSGPLAAILLGTVVGAARLTTTLLARATLALTREGLGLITGLFAPTARDRSRGRQVNPAVGGTKPYSAASPSRALVAAPLGSGTAPAGASGSRTGSGVDRVVARKVNQATGLWEVQLRYSSTLTPPSRQAARLTPAGWRGVRRACAGHAGELAGAMAIYSGHNHLLRRPLHPADWPALDGRWMVGGQLLSTVELAALAHLPTDTRIPGLARAGAIAVDQPPELLTS